MYYCHYQYDHSKQNVGNDNINNVKIKYKLHKLEIKGKDFFLKAAKLESNEWLTVSDLSQATL